MCWWHAGSSQSPTRSPRSGGAGTYSSLSDLENSCQPLSFITTAALIFASLLSIYFWDMLSFDNSWQNRHSLFKLIYRTILIARYNWVMLLGLSQMLQKNFLGGWERQSRKAEKGGKSLCYQGHPLSSPLWRTSCSTILRPPYQQWSHFCSKSSKHRWAWFQRELTDIRPVKKLWTLCSSSKSLIQFSWCLKHKPAFC